MSSKRIKALILIIGFVVIAFFIDTDETSSPIQETTNQQETSTQSSTTQEKPVDKETTTAKLLTKQQSGKIIKIFEDDTIGDFNIWGDKIVFLGGGKKYDWAIYLYDISTNELKRITYDPSAKKLPLIYKDLIFWNDERFVQDVFMYNISSEKEVMFFKNSNKEYVNLRAIHDDVLFITIGRKGYLYYINKNSLEDIPDKLIEIPTEKINDASYFYLYGNMYGDKTVFTKQHGVFRNIFYYDILNNVSIQITNNTLDEAEPDIYKNKIVWSDNRNGKFNYDIYLYDLDTKQETQITSQQDTNELHPSIYGDYIVYFKSGKEKNIYLYNIKTKEEKKIPEKAGLINENPLKLYDNKVVWRTCKNDWCADEELYVYII